MTLVRGPLGIQPRQRPGPARVVRLLRPRRLAQRCCATPPASLP